MNSEMTVAKAKVMPKRKRIQKTKIGKPTVETQVKLSITSESASPAQTQAWRRFWQRLITEVKDK